MKNVLFITVFICIAGFITLNSKPLHIQNNNSTKNTKIDIVKPKEVLSESQQLFDEINLKGKLKFTVFDMALNGYNSLKHNFRNSNIITVIDFSLPSTEKRMYVIDLKNKKLLYQTIVSHGKNSGDVYATNFSNRNGSHQSSLGFFVTEKTYQGGNGYSLVINGLEKNINDQAKARAVVIHGADYCNESVIKNTGRLGRSYGCPALPRELNKPIINTIKDGSMLFIYADNTEYFASSRIIKNHDRSMLAQHEEIETGTNAQGVMQ